VGKLLAAVEDAAGLLMSEGIDVTIWDPRVVSAPDPAMLADAGRHRVVITAEDGIRQGGAGMFLADALDRSLPCGAAPPVVNLGIPRAYLAQGKPDRILSDLGLDAEGLALAVRKTVAARADVLAGQVPAAPAVSLPATFTAQENLD
jgi:1-deoxy-D-xylulose-5-phosphate synthase